MCAHKRCYLCFTVLALCLSFVVLCSSCGKQFPPGGKPIEVSRTTDGITFKMTIGKSSYSGIIECDSTPNAMHVWEHLSDYKVVVYVETDKLYIHPYFGSYSAIESDGSWRVSKVDRDPPPRAVYAFIVGKGESTPDEVFNKGDLSHITYVAWYEE